MICSVIYPVRFISTVIISKRFRRRIITLWFGVYLYMCALKMENAAVKHLHAATAAAAAAAFWHCVCVIKRQKENTYFSLSLSSSCFNWIYNFITDSIFYTFANCFKRPINNMCNLWVSSSNHIYFKSSNQTCHRCCCCSSCRVYWFFVWLFVQVKLCASRKWKKFETLNWEEK